MVWPREARSSLHDPISQYLPGTCLPLQKPSASPPFCWLKRSLQVPLLGLTSSLVLHRCENGEQCQGGSGSRGQLEKKREKAIVSEQGAALASGAAATPSRRHLHACWDKATHSPQ